jgi:hypothetical protein
MEDVLDVALRRKPQALKTPTSGTARPAREAQPTPATTPSFPPTDQPPAVADTALGNQPLAPASERPH